MKILIISDAWKPQINGVVRTYEYLIPELEKKGHTVRVIGPADFIIKPSMPGYSEIKIALFTHNKLKRIIKKFEPDTIHLATEGALGIAAQKICVKRNIPFSSSYHTQFPDYLRKRVEKAAPFAADFCYNKVVEKVVAFHNTSSSILVTTPTIKKQLEEWGVTKPIHLFTRGIEQSKFYLRKDKTPLEELSSLKLPIALYVGRIAVEKNIKDFLDMKWDGSKIVVGQGPDHNSLKRKYKNILFTGKKTGTDLAKYYRGADVFVFPSKTDTFGMVIIEALACGIPIAAYPVAGPQDIVTEDFLGALDNDLATAAQKALQHDIKEKDAIKLKRAEYTKEHYTWKKAAEQFIAACPTSDKQESA